jgi:hypothetical protein
VKPTDSAPPHSLYDDDDNNDDGDNDDDDDDDDNNCNKGCHKINSLYGPAKKA